MRARAVVSCFLVRGDQVLMLRRSASVATYPGKWAGVSGTLESGDVAAEALREIAEETGLRPPEVAVLRRGSPWTVEDALLGVAWTVHPVLVDVAEGVEPRLDWEHVEARWIRGDEVASLDGVPGLAEALRRAFRGT